MLVVTVPFLPLLGSVTTNSVTALPANSPSGQANAELARLFPSEPGASSSTLLFYGPNLTDANAQQVLLNVSAAIAADRSLAFVQSIQTVYIEYAQFLAGQAKLAEGVLSAALTNATPLPTAVNDSAQLLWIPPALFVSTWSSLLGVDCTLVAAAGCNYPAYEATASALAGSTASLLVLNAFYNASDGGFNRTSGCATVPAVVVACADSAARATEAPLIPVLVPAPSEQLVPTVVLAGLGIEDYTTWSSVQAAASDVLAQTAGLPASFFVTVWNAFPHGFPYPDAPFTWANATIVNATLATEPLPVPYAISSQFVAPGGTAQVIKVRFSESDDYTESSGNQPVYSDLGKIDSLVSSVLSSSDPTRSISYLQTGYAPLDRLTQTSVNESIALVLPLTVGLLLAIAMLYFRSPVTPLVTFGGLAIALVLGLGATILIGTVVGHVDTTSITLEEVFVLGVGTDYAIFLVARYREELVRGKTPDDALVTAVTWAGKSVATSGSAAVLATLALTFSGVALLSQWGSVLSVAVLIALVLSLTMIPAFLKLLGPRIFWPYTGERFRRQATVLNARQAREETYFYRAGRATQRHPWTFVTALLVISVPLVAVALTAPLAYDFYQQLPSGHPATDGLAELGNQFGPGFAVPSYGLVTFASPLLVGNTTNATDLEPPRTPTIRTITIRPSSSWQTSPTGPRPRAGSRPSSR
jgi:RND superfamily putative drug exporter